MTYSLPRLTLHMVRVCRLALLGRNSRHDFIRELCSQARKVPFVFHSVTHWRFIAVGVFCLLSFVIMVYFVYGDV